MKKMLLGSIALLLFSTSLLIVQISCSKTNAQTSSNAVTQLNKIIFYKQISTGKEIWIANYDGSGATQIPVALPPNVNWDLIVTSSSLSISPDGQKIFFTVSTTGSSPTSEIYSCDISGGNVTLIATGGVGKVQAF